MITYSIDQTPEIEKIINLYKRAPLNRPDDRRRMELMVQHANIKVAAWDGPRLVGFLRGFTDYCFDCYINDLAVDPDYQGQGIGSNLLSHTKKLLAEGTLIFLIAAPDAVPFYRKLGYKNFISVEDTWYLKVTPE